MRTTFYAVLGISIILLVVTLLTAVAGAQEEYTVFLPIVADNHAATPPKHVQFWLLFHMEGRDLEWWPIDDAVSYEIYAVPDQLGSHESEWVLVDRVPVVPGTTKYVYPITCRKGTWYTVQRNGYRIRGKALFMDELVPDCPGDWHLLSK